MGPDIQDRRESEVLKDCTKDHMPPLVPDILMSWSIQTIAICLRHLTYQVDSEPNF